MDKINRHFQKIKKHTGKTYKKNSLWVIKYYHGTKSLENTDIKDYHQIFYSHNQERKSNNMVRWAKKWRRLDHVSIRSNNKVEIKQGIDDFFNEKLENSLN